MKVPIVATMKIPTKANPSNLEYLSPLREIISIVKITRNPFRYR